MSSKMALFALVAVGIASITTPAFAQPPEHRKTTDPPIMSHGKMVQELFLAIDHRDTAGVRTLLKKGADPNSRNGLEITPLDIAAASHQTEVMEALLKAGASVEGDSLYGTPMTFAALTANVPGINLLLAHGAKVDPFRADGITPLMLAARTGAADAVKLLLDRKAEVDAKDAANATALTYAAREGQMDAGKLLLAAGATVDNPDSIQQTPLMQAAVNGHADFVRLLLEKGANPNAKDAKGRTALVLAATYGDYPNVVRALLTGGADASLADAQQRTALNLASMRGNDQSVKALIEAKAGTTPERMGRKRTIGEGAQVGFAALQSAMLTFSQRATCVSCHHEGLGRMATATAWEHGLPIDPTLLKEQAGRVNGALTATRPLHENALKNPAAMKQIPLIEINEVTTAYSWLLTGMAAQKQPGDPGAAAMAMVLARQQLPNGSWGFTLPRAPMQSSPFTFTALAIRSLKAYGPKANSSEIARRVALAKAWLLNTPAKTSEDRAARLLGLKWAGATASERKKAIAEIRADQRPNGGWSQLPNLLSDAYATGQALYALHVAGDIPVTDAVYQRGVEYLLRTQDDDGSWFVYKRADPINLYFDGGFPHGQSQYASFNGSCWATMALLQAVDKPRQQASR